MSETQPMSDEIDEVLRARVQELESENARLLKTSLNVEQIAESFNRTVMEERDALKHKVRELESQLAQRGEPIGRVASADEFKPYPHIVRTRDVTERHVGMMVYLSEPLKPEPPPLEPVYRNAADTVVIFEANGRTAEARVSVKHDWQWSSLPFSRECCGCDMLKSDAVSAARKWVEGGGE